MPVPGRDDPQRDRPAGHRVHAEVDHAVAADHDQGVDAALQAEATWRARSAASAAVSTATWIAARIRARGRLRTDRGSRDPDPRSG